MHSLLHILGYDHIQENDYKIMQSLENQIWEEVFGEKDK
ncbi:MAG: rRNA maturation RNAse YbeY [Candidatus Peribacteria bacterium]|nr:MAG: rRNA maturation RNAse YbeY [Candidatus Peribacteria bacterium]